MTERLTSQVDRIAQVRVATGLSDDEIADRILLKRDTMRKYSKGYQPASDRIMTMIEQLPAQLRRERPPLAAQPTVSVREEGPIYDTGPRFLLKRAREAAGLTPDQLGKKAKVPPGYIRQIEEGEVRGSNEKNVRRLAETLGLDPDALLSGSDHPRIIDQTGRRGTFGATPNIDLPPGRRARYVPLLSWAQAGQMDAGFTDDAYDHSGTISIDINDRKAFGVTIRGDSMTPRLNEGDDAIVCPTWQARNGDTVIARTVNGDVMCKLFQTKEGGTKIVLSSYNPAYPPIELNRDEIAWIYPVGQVVQNLRKE